MHYNFFLNEKCIENLYNQVLHSLSLLFLISFLNINTAYL